LLVENIASVAEKMWHLKEHQVGFSIDDLNAVILQLRYLTAFSYQAIKRRSILLFRDLSNDPNSHVNHQYDCVDADHMNLSVLRKEGRKSDRKKYFRKK